MMRALRKRMSIFLWFIAAAFILFIFLQWGMNVAGRKNGGRHVNVIAKVNGISIGTQTYIQKLSAMLNNLRNSQNLTHLEPLTERIVEENAFEELVQKALLMDEMKKNKIVVTNNEVKEILKISPPKEILEDSTMYTNGRFDPQKYLEVLLNPANRYFLYEMRNRIREEYPVTKLNLMYTSGIKVTQTEILKFYQEESLKVKVTYIPFRVEDYLNKVSVREAELMDYYAVHKAEYETSEGIRLKSVSFEVKPSLTDEMEAKREIDDIYNLYNGGMNFDTLAMDYSQDGNTNQDGGDLGFIKRGELDPEMEKVTFSLKKGEVSKPFQTSFGWHILKVTDSKGRERRISHILIRIATGYETISGIREKINNFKNGVKEAGFEESAKLSNLETTEIVLYKEDSDLVPEIGRVIGISNFIFSKKRKENDVIGPFIGYDGNFHLFLVGTYIEPRIKNFEEIKEKIEEKARREKALDIAKENAQSCFEKIKEGKSLNQAASIFHKKPRTTNFFSMRDFIPEVPYSSEFYGLAFTMKKGDIGLTSTKKGTFIIELVERKEAEKEDFEQLSATLFVNIMMKKRNDYLSYWLQELRKNAKIDDDRYLIDMY
ncbi:MAG: hypothetical protein E3J41_06930 [Candidatus Cloacimonadota bacterium]|nr:MAG: hypothetical protein E3J41_06930 [Candidatus Cloacimonadota bacterium]